MTRVAADITHDPNRRSFVESAREPDTDFPLQNLPYGVFRSASGEPRIGVAIGNQVLDVQGAVAAGVLLVGDRLQRACSSHSLNDLMALGHGELQQLRHAIHELLREGSSLSRDRGVQERALHDAESLTMLLPADIGDYTDFYASIDHATNVGSMFRPDNPLLPNYKWVPMGYHGRASSVVVSGTPVRRPHGQIKAAESDTPVFAPTKRLDYELELGAWIGRGNILGKAISIEEANEHLFGVSLLNDWSARDVQAWEYQPLGPFLAKNFLTTVSPWVVTADALLPFRTPVPQRAADDPRPLAYLDAASDRESGALGITLTVYIESAEMRAKGLTPFPVSTGDFRRMYWTFAQLIAHHTSGGCNLRPGDLIGSGTISGPARSERGCLLELTWGGKEPIALPSGEKRTFLEDGDAVIFRARCEREGAAGIGFGECRGLVLPVL